MKLSNNSKLQKYTKNCKNQNLVNSYIKNYQQYTKDTVENILKIGSLVLEMKNKKDLGLLDESDMKYFCFSVGITEKGSTFRKFKKIGEYENQFRKYLDKLPDSYTVLYQITTLEPELFDELMKNNDIHSYVTLKDIKELSGKVPLVNKSFSGIPKRISKQQMSTIIKSMNKFSITVSRNITESEYDQIINFLDAFQRNNLISFEIPQITIRMNDDVIDVVNELEKV